MDRLQLFDVFASSWFTAIYVLLFVSLVGCLTPRILEHLRAVRARPVPAPRNLTRLPRHLEDTVEGTPEEVVASSTPTSGGAGAEPPPHDQRLRTDPPQP